MQSAGAFAHGVSKVCCLDVLTLYAELSLVLAQQCSLLNYIQKGFQGLTPPLPP